MKRCVKQAKCAYCSQPILSGDYMICGKLWLTRSEESVTTKAKKWLIRKYWHRVNSDGHHCWEEQAKFHVDQLPAPIIKSGRKRIVLSDEDKVVRNKILNRRSTVIQRIRSEWEKPLEIIDYDELSHLGAMLDKCKKEIVSVGGVPRSWEDGNAKETQS